MVTCASPNNLIEMPEWFFKVPMENSWSNLGAEIFRVPQKQWIFFKTCIIRLWTPGFNWWNSLISWCETFVSGETLDLSTTSYADDEAKGKLFKDGQELHQLVLAEDMALSHSLQRICTAQHTGKQGHNVSMRGWEFVGRHATYLHCGFFKLDESPRASNIWRAGFISRADKRKRLPFVSTLQMKHGHTWRVFGTNPEQRASWCSRV